MFHGDAERTFRDFFGGDNPFAGRNPETILIVNDFLTFCFFFTKNFLRQQKKIKD